MFATTPVIFDGCEFNHEFRGLWIPRSVFQSYVQNCYFKNSWGGKTTETFDYRNAIGFLSSGHCTVIAGNFIGCGTGAMLYGNDVGFYNGRFEVNGVGLILGTLSAFTPTLMGTLVPLQNATVTTVQFEANYRQMEILSASSTVGVSDVQAQGSVGAPPNPEGKSQLGLYLGSAAGKLENAFFGGEYSRAAAELLVENVIFNNVSFLNGSGAAPHILGGSLPFSVRSTRSRYSMRRYEYSRGIAGTTALGEDTLSVFSDLQLRSLCALDIRKPNAQGRQLGAQNVPVTPGTSLAVTFSATAWGSGNTPFVAPLPAAVADAGSTLPAGVYQYVATILAPHGETGLPNTLNSQNWYSVTVAAGQRVDATIQGSSLVPTTWTRRIYRTFVNRTDWQGFWEQLVPDLTFSDTGAAFHGVGGPPLVATGIPVLTEPNANYGVVVTPSWGTTTFITAKTTGGFTINFGTTAPAGATVDWLIFRAPA